MMWCGVVVISSLLRVINGAHVEKKFPAAAKDSSLSIEITQKRSQHLAGEAENVFIKLFN